MPTWKACQYYEDLRKPNPYARHRKGIRIGNAEDQQYQSQAHLSKRAWALLVSFTSPLLLSILQRKNHRRRSTEVGAKKTTSAGITGDDVLSSQGCYVTKLGQLLKEGLFRGCSLVLFEHFWFSLTPNCSQAIWVCLGDKTRFNTVTYSTNYDQIRGDQRMLLMLWHLVMSHLLRFKL